MSTKKTPKKAAQKKVSQPKKSTVKLTSFTIMAIIPTEQYGNIQPSVTVQANSIEEASAVVLPYIDSLMVKYSQNPPKASVASIAKFSAPMPEKIVKETTTAPKNEKKDEPASPEVSVPYQKALNAIKTAYSLVALETISDAIIFSKKLHDGEKIKLKPIVEAKKAELEAK